MGNPNGFLLECHQVGGFCSASGGASSAFLNEEPAPDVC